MLLKINVKKLVAVFMAVVMVLAAMPALADVTSDNSMLFTADFEGYTSDGDDKPQGKKADGSTFAMTVWNADIANSAAIIVPGNDPEYGTTLVMTKSASSNKALGVGLADTFISSTTKDPFDSTKNLVIETAVKRTAVSGSDIVIDMAMPDVAGKNYTLVKLGKDGKLYANIDPVAEKNTEVGKYETDTWYELKIELSPSTKLATVTIDGGEYENTLVYCSEMSGNAARMLIFGFRNTATVASDLHIGYLNVYYTAPKALSDIGVNFATTFDGFKVGNLQTNSYGNNGSLETSAGRVDYFANGMFHRYNGAVKTDVQIVDLVDELSSELGAGHGKGLKVGHNAIQNQLYYELTSPYAQNLSSGIVVFEYDFLADSSGLTSAPMIWLSDTSNNTVYKNHVLTTGNDIDANKWYRIISVIDLDNDKYSLYAYDINTPNVIKKTVASNVVIDKDAVLKRLNFYSGKPGSSRVDPTAWTYMDNIKIYSSADLSFDKALNIGNASVKSDLAKPVVVSYNTPLSSANVKLTCNGAEVDATKTIVGKTVSVIPVTGAFAPESNYKIELTDITDVFGNKTDKTIEFTTGKKYTLTYQLVRRDSNTNETTPIDELEQNACIAIELSSNDGTKFGLRGGVGVYDKSTNELLKLTAWNLTAEDQLKTYRKWDYMPTQIDNPDTQYVKLFVWEADMTPMHEAVTFSK